MRRAAHQLVDTPLVFTDPLAVRIVGGPPGERERAVMMEREQDRAARALRAFMAVCSRYAEDSLADAVNRGVRQYVLLGAGLDTFAYRNPYEGVRVFEVDHPATQAWKKECLQAAGIEPPSTMTFAPVNFETETVLDGLRSAGFRDDQSAFFAWLGVTMYLERDTVMAMFKTIANLAKPTGVVFDYGIDRALLGLMERMALDLFAARVAKAGEPWITFFKPEELVADLRAIGFNDIEDLGPAQINERYFKDRRDGLKVGTLAHLLKGNAF